MKYIFDFDDVLFNNTKQFKDHMYACLEKAGIPRTQAKEYYKGVRISGFWLKEMLSHFSLKEDWYEKILERSENFLNKDLVNEIKKLGKENCYIVTHGGEEWQLDKIKKTDITSLFSKIIVVQGSKKESVEKICAKHKNEKVIFIDDKVKHFENLDFKKYPNLKTILYTGQSVESLMEEINK
ncbi:MAG: HAD hydrolase-like protein [Patescibacteria group bacterium]